MLISFFSAKIISASIVVIAALLIGTSIYTWQKSTMQIQPLTPQPAAVGNISTWKTYHNDQYGFEVKYPESLKVNEEQMFTNVRPGFSVIFTDKPTPLPVDAHYFYPLQVYVFKKTDVPPTALRKLQLGKFDIRDLLYPLKNEQEVEALTQGYTFTNLEALKVHDLEVTFTKVGDPLAGEPEQVVIFDKDNLYALLADYSPLQNLTTRQFVKLVLTEFQISNSASVPQGWKTYRNEKYGFEMKYPQNWEMNGKDTDISFWFVNRELNQKYMEAAKNIATEGFAFNNGLLLTVYQTNKPLEEFIQQRYNDPKGGAYGSKIRSIKKVKFPNGLPAIFVDYDTYGVTAPATLLSHGNYVFEFSEYYGGSFGLEKYKEEDFYQILSTFKFTK